MTRRPPHARPVARDEQHAPPAPEHRLQPLPDLSRGRRGRSHQDDLAPVEQRRHHLRPGVPEIRDQQRPLQVQAQLCRGENPGHGNSGDPAPGPVRRSASQQCDLVFVPGLVSHLELQWQQLAYRRFVTALERACRVIRFDKRGTGLSDPTDALPGMDQRVADLAAVMDAAGSQAAVVFGISDGGRGAIAFAAAHPGRVRGLVLYGTSYRGPRPGLLDRYRTIVGRWGEGDLLELVGPSLVGPISRDAAGAFERAAASPGMVAALIESMGRADVSDLLAALRMPVLVVHRQEDMIPLDDARAVAGAIPGAVLRVVPGRDHLPWAGEWEPVVQAVTGFIYDIAGPGTAPAKRPRAAVSRREVGWPALTEGEWRVVMLAAQGHTNAEIADQLYLSRYTVETHLKHVFAKLGLRSRAELAAVAASAPSGQPDT